MAVSEIQGASAPGRRERKRAQTHEALIEAAMRLFHRKGFEATTVEDITEAVDVSPRTFFRHFGTKEDVVFAGHEAQIELLDAALAERPADEPILDAIVGAIGGLAHVLDGQSDVIQTQRMLVESSSALRARSAQLRDQLAGVVADFVAERLGVSVETDLRPMLVGGAVVGALGAAIDTWAEVGDNLPARVNEALALLSQGYGLDA